MKLSEILLTAALAVTATAQMSADQIALSIPECARTCLADAAKSAGCGPTEYDCQCHKTAQITAGSAECVAKECSADDVTMTTLISASVCEAVRRGEVATRTAPLQPAGASTTPPSGKDRPEDDSGEGSGGGSDDKSGSGAGIMVPGAWMGAAGLVGVLALAL